MLAVKTDRLDCLLDWYLPESSWKAIESARYLYYYLHSGKLFGWFHANKINWVVTELREEFFRLILHGDEDFDVCD